jgi:hypothetical protein
MYWKLQQGPEAETPPRPEPGDSIVIRFPWSTNPENQPLTSGLYYCQADFMIKVDHEQRALNLRSGFSMH